DRAASAGGELVAVGELEGGGGERQAGHAGVTVHRFERLGAETALGLVVDAFEREVVGGLRDEAEISEGIADLGPLVEPKTAYDSIVEADLYEAVFELARLVLSTHEDRHLLQRQAFAFEPLDFLADAARFFGGVPHADDADLLAGGKLCREGLAAPPAVGLDHARSGGEVLRRGAIVLFEPDHRRAGKALFEPQDVRDFCAAP